MIWLLGVVLVACISRCTGQSMWVPQSTLESVNETLAACDAVPACSMVLLAAGTYTGSAGIAFAPSKTITILGAGANETILDGGGTLDVLFIHPSASLLLNISHLTVANGRTGVRLNREEFSPHDITATLDHVNIHNQTRRGLSSAYINVALNDCCISWCFPGAVVERGEFRAASTNFTDNISNEDDSTRWLVRVGGLLLRYCTAISVRGCRFDRNINTVSTSSSAGGLGIDKPVWGNTIVQDCTFTDNFSNHSGGGAFVGSTSTTTSVVFESCVFVNNSARIRAGALEFDHMASATVTACTFQNNSAIGTDDIALSGKLFKGGGALFFDSNSNENVQDSYFDSNVAQWYGGAVGMGPSMGLTVWRGNTYRNNTAERGGAICVGSISAPRVFQIAEETFVGNVAMDMGGALFLEYAAESWITVDASQFLSNSAREGAGVYATSASPFNTLTVTNSLLEGNAAADRGGGVHMNNHILDIDSCVFRGNTARRGGGISSAGPSGTVTNVTATANTVSLDGGGVYVHGADSFTLERSTLIGNTATKGGGLACISSRSATISTCTFAHNSAVLGAGMSVDTVPDVAVVDCDLMHNAAANTGGGMDWNTVGGNVARLSMAGNTAGQRGGAWHVVLSSASMVDSAMEDSVAGLSGGGLASEMSSVTLYAVEMRGNTAQGGHGGALYGYQTRLVVDGSTLASNVASSGGGVAVHEEVEGAYALNMTDTSIVANEALVDGGGVSILRSSARLVEVSLTDNAAGVRGGCVHVLSSTNVTLLRSTLTNCTAEDGGGISAETCHLDVRSSAISGCSASKSGGALYLAAENACVNASISVGVSNTVGSCTAARGGCVFVEDVARALAWTEGSDAYEDCHASRYGNQRASNQIAVTMLNGTMADSLVTGRELRVGTVPLAAAVVDAFDQVYYWYDSPDLSAYLTVDPPTARTALSDYSLDRGVSSFGSLRVLSPLVGPVTLTFGGPGDVRAVLHTVTVEECPFEIIDSVCRCGAGTSGPTCTPCAPGSYAAVGTLSACIPCPLGHFAAGNRSTSCSPCSPGTFSGNESAHSCHACAPGTVADGSASASCSPCSVGTYAQGGVSCVPCEVGTAGGTEGLAACPRCFPGFIALSGQIACDACPAGSYASLRKDVCLPCRAHASCVGGVTKPKPGFFLDLTTDEYIACQDEDQLACTSDGCGEGHVDSFLCTACDRGGSPKYARRGGRCVKCWHDALSLLVIVLVSAIVIAYVVHSAWMADKETGVGPIVFKTFVSHLQQLSIILSASSIRSTVVADVFGFSSAASPSMDTQPFQCLFDMNYYDIFAVQVTVPLVVGGALVGVHVALVRSSHVRGGNAAVAAIVQFFYIIYPSLSKSILHVFACREDVHLLEIDNRLSCLAPDRTTVLVFAVLFIVVYCLGIPSTFSAVLYRANTNAGLSHPTTKARFYFLYGMYTEEAYLFESVVLFRKTLMVAMVAFVSDPTVELGALGAILLGSVVAHHFIQPYDSTTLNNLDLESMALNVATCFAGYVASPSFLILVVVGHGLFTVACLACAAHITYTEAHAISTKDIVLDDIVTIEAPPRADLGEEEDPGAAVPSLSAETSPCPPPRADLE